MPSLEILLNNADLTPRVRSFRIEQPADTIYRRFKLDLVGTHDIPDDGRWDVFWSQIGAPRETVLIRQGVLAPGWREAVRFGRDRRGEAIAPVLRLEGYDGVYLATRRSPRDTIVLASNHAKAAAAVRRSSTVLGRWRWVEARTLHDAIRWLASQAGLSAKITLPNHAFSASVLAPTGAGLAPAATSSSYWSHLMGLIRPWNAEVLYRRESNTLLISDRLTDVLSPPGAGVALGQAQIARVTWRPMRRRNVTRVVGRIPCGLC